MLGDRVSGGLHEKGDLVLRLGVVKPDGYNGESLGWLRGEVGEEVAWPLGLRGKQRVHSLEQLKGSCVKVRIALGEGTRWTHSLGTKDALPCPGLDLHQRGTTG
jgi:hypothetical protein